MCPFTLVSKGALDTHVAAEIWLSKPRASSRVLGASVTRSDKAQEQKQAAVPVEAKPAAPVQR